MKKKKLKKSRDSDLTSVVFSKMVSVHYLILVGKCGLYVEEQAFSGLSSGFLWPSSLFSFQ